MVVVARMWRLDDGTECTVAQSDSSWCVVVVRAGTELRRELFSDGRRALLASRAWRAEFAAQIAAA